MAMIPMEYDAGSIIKEGTYTNITVNADGTKPCQSSPFLYDLTKMVIAVKDNAERAWVMYTSTGYPCVYTPNKTSGTISGTYYYIEK